MSLRHLRRFEAQADYAFGLSLASVVPLLGAMYLALRNYEPDLGQIVYGAKGLFLPAFLACVLLSALPGALAFALGWSSAGQRRNDRPTRSWIGFFLGGLVATLDVILLIAFWMLRLQHPT